MPILSLFFFDLLNNDPYEENRALAATQMMKVITDNSYEHVNQAAQNPLEMIRYNVAQKLQDSKVSFASDILSLLLEDESFYVKRAAALSSLSLGNKEGIDVLLGTLDKETLDTTDNYGDNIFNSLAYYVGVDFGLDKDAWLAWWKKERDTFEFPSKEKKAA